MVSRLESSQLAGYVELVGGSHPPDQKFEYGPESLLAHANSQFTAMELVVSRMQKVKVNQTESRLGGVMIVAQEGEQNFSLIRQVGQIISDPNRSAIAKKTRYDGVALGKYKALVDNPKFISSSENITSLPKDKRLVVDGLEIPGGALRFKDGSISVFSGFGTPEEDECVVIASKVLVGDMTKLESIEFAKSIGNNIYVSSVDYLIGHSDEVPPTLREEIRYEHKFGDSQLTGESSAALELFYSLLKGENTDYDQLALVLGWSEGCPVVPEVIEKGGSKEAAKGYAELQFIRGNILDLLKKHSPTLYREFTSTQSRNEGEPAGRYDLRYTPKNHKEYIRGAATAAGFIFPRLVREFIGKRGEEGRSERTLQAFDIVEKVIKKYGKTKSITPNQLVVQLAEEFVLADPIGIESASVKYLNRLFSQGKLEEDNQHTDYSDLRDYMKMQNSNLWKAYTAIENQIKH